jgi:hypothetical protein
MAKNQVECQSSALPPALPTTSECIASRLRPFDRAMRCGQTGILHKDDTSRPRFVIFPSAGTSSFHSAIDISRNRGGAATKTASFSGTPFGGGHSFRKGSDARGNLFALPVEPAARRHKITFPVSASDSPPASIDRRQRPLYPLPAGPVRQPCASVLSGVAVAETVNLLLCAGCVANFSVRVW